MLNFKYQHHRTKISLSYCNAQHNINTTLLAPGKGGFVMWSPDVAQITRNAEMHITGQRWTSAREVFEINENLIHQNPSPYFVSQTCNSLYQTNNEGRHLTKSGWHKSKWLHSWLIKWLQKPITQGDPNNNKRLMVKSTINCSILKQKSTVYYLLVYQQTQ